MQSEGTHLKLRFITTLNLQVFNNIDYIINVTDLEQKSRSSTIPVPRGLISYIFTAFFILKLYFEIYIILTNIYYLQIYLFFNVFLRTR